MKRMIAVVSTAATAMLVMAALSVGTAGAATTGVVVCEYDEIPCPTEAVQPAGGFVVTGNIEDYLSFTVGGSGLTDFECSSNTMTAINTAARAKTTLPGEFNGTLNSCRIKATKTSCTGSMNSPLTKLEVEKGVYPYFTIGSAAEPLNITFNCGSGESAVSCTYQAKEGVRVLLHLEGEAKVVNAALSKTSGPNTPCNPSSPKLWVRNLAVGDYVSLSSGGSAICKTSEEFCAPSNRYGSGTPFSTTLQTSTKLFFTNPINTTECTGSSLAGQLTGTGGTAQGVPVEISSASITGCNNGTTLTPEGFPWTGTFSDLEGTPNGVLHIDDMEFKYFRFGITCVFKGAVDAQVYSNSGLYFGGVKLDRISGSFLCGGAGSGSLSGTYTLGAPSPFYLTWL